MELTLFNTLTRSKERFNSLTPLHVGMYTCGPTVYNFMHIGNLRSFLFEDVLRRTLMLNDYKVEHVMNITDVGHLTSDADDGEDKMLKGAKREQKTVWEIAEFYTHAFVADCQRLNLLAPTVLCKATDHITEQINMIRALEKKGFTYVHGGNVYFDTSKLPDYGKLARLQLNAETKARVDQDENKKHPHDFVLWFTKSKFQDQEMKWPSPWGVGYPGWHIECSAMATKYLGEQFDIHCGGIDHIPVHHTNEIAQTEGVTGKKPWVKYWMHGEFLVISSGEKMAKSGENFVILQTLIDRGIDPLDYRYFCLGTHYRNPLMFSFEALEGAKNARRRLNEKVLEFKKEGAQIIDRLERKAFGYLDNFTSDVNDDLNTPKALAIVWDVVKDDELTVSEKYSLLLKMDAVLGLKLDHVMEEKVPAAVVRLAHERLKARVARDWIKSDELRAEIDAMGWIVGDTKEGFELKKK